MSEVKPVHRYKAQTMFSFGGAKIEYFPRGPDVVMASEYDAQRLRADTAEADLLRTSDALLAAEQRIARMEAALKYYADENHFSTDDGMNWDSCSGEPSNILWHEEQPWFIEDGSIARAALNPKPEAGSHAVDI